jgi:NADH-quinone oxidoreductase subunit M
MPFILNSIIWLPLLTGLLIALIPGNYKVIIRFLAVASTFITMLLGLVLFLNFTSDLPGYQFESSRSWVEGIGINYHVGVDGINIGLILMGTIVAFAAACVSREIKSSEKLCRERSGARRSCATL